MKLGWRNIPNLLSLSRVFFGFAFVATFSVERRLCFLVATSMLAVAFATDFADGRLARRWNVATKTGYFLDSLGDKALYVAIYLVIGREDRTQLLLCWTLIAREMILYAMRLIDENRQHNIARLRFLSWCYAYSVWAYFAGFLTYEAGRAFCADCTPYSSAYPAFGYLALGVGAFHIAKLFSVMTKETYSR